MHFYAFWWLQDFSEICIFPWENAYFFCFSAGCRKCIFHISLILSKNPRRFSWNYAFLMAPRFLRNMHFSMHFSMGKCIFFLLFGWLQKMHISYFVDFVQKLRFSWNYAFLMVPRFFRNMHFFHGKMHIFLLFGWLQKMHISYFVDFVSKNQGFHGIMHFWWFQDLSEICIFPWENAYFFCFSAGCRKCIIPYFWKKSWSHQKCIIPWKPWFLDKINEIWNMHFLQPAEKQKNMHFPIEKNAYFSKILEPSKMHNSMKTLVFGQNQRNMKYAFSAASRKAKKICIFPWKNAYFWKILEPSKMHIENAYFLRAIKNAYWKCILFACYFYGHIQKCIVDSGRPTFLICTVSPKAVRGWSFDLCILNFQHAHHDAKTFWVQKLPGNITQNITKSGLK